MSEIQLRIEGMHCGACIRRVTQALESVPGAQVEAVSLGSAVVRVEDASLPPQTFIDTLQQAGFKAVQGN